MLIEEIAYKPTQVMLAYLAGIIDGEGCIGIECMGPCQRKNGTWARKHNYYTPRLTVVNTNKFIMFTLMRCLGGTFDIRKTIAGRKTCYRWHVFGKKLEESIKSILPYLQIKHEQARLVLEFRETVGKTGWHVAEGTLQKRHQLYIQCRDLNKVGS